MPIAADPDQPRLFLELMAATENPELKQAFVLATLVLPRAGFLVAPEQHGIMSSLGIYRGEDWCFSIKPARKWLKVWVRRPEISRYFVTEADMVRHFETVSVTSAQEVTARLASFADTERFLALLMQSAVKT